MTRMNVEEFRQYLIDTIKNVDDRHYLEEIGKAVLGEGVKYIPVADGFEILDDTMPDSLRGSL